ncbi:MAG TPA: hypothetical protein PKN61_04380 [Acidobacteriota bacterium]|nr:hypothetical protein [Acidobacteriota bacterium]HNU00744.1 hypothetical protein [Acidobacteriota bacterium]HUN19428.1 hypothetical protein [Caldisericia bacterium]
MAERIKENRLDFPESAPGPMELNSIQKQVFEILSATKSQKYSLAAWYLGAIYAAKNIYNPDRFSQAAQSLRELLEKLPRVFVESEIQESRPDFRGMRVNLYSRLCSDKNRYEGEWNGKTIDAGLDKTIRGVDKYFELNQIPTRKEQIHSVMSKIDPMHDALDQGIRLEKSERFHSVWKFFEALAHHNTHPDEETFWQQLSLTERIVIDLLAPITAQDQGAIRTILEKPQPEQGAVENMLELIKRRGANYAYFFKTVDNPVWINPLSQNGFFKNPPGVEAAGDGRIITPLWWPIFYLQRVSEQNPEQVVEIILGLEQTDNPRILREIVSIACDLKDTALSLRLKPLIKQFLKSPYRWGEEELIVKILKKWGSDQGPPRNAAHEIIQYAIAFQPDPKEDEKQSRRKDNPEAWNTSLEPNPRFDQWEYQQILEKGVRPLAEHEPYQVSRILIDAVASMIRLGMHPEDFEKGNDQDYSEIWCRRLDKPDRDYQDVKGTLVQTLTYACEQVYDKAPESIDALDQALRNHRWKVFKRLRQHLYASHPNDQTLPWIREQILGHEDYPKWKHHYEFQLMIHKASEHFGPRLLSEDERERIVGAILSGPSNKDFRERMGERYSEEAFQKHQRYFHRVQLRPFTALFSGDVRQYFDELEGESSAEAVTDDSYSPYGGVTSGFVSYRSPKSAEDLESLTDEELLTYLNDWSEEHRERDDWLVEINISALAGVFQSLFKEKIVPDDERLAFWLANRDRIARPVYVAAMLKAMLEIIKEKNFDKLDQWLEFCAWVLSHPDTARVEGQPEPRDESRDHPDWGSSRRVVVDFIDACVSKDTEVPVSARNTLARLLQEVCNQFDWRLDHNRPVLLNRDDPFTEAINNTRSRALESLIKFGFWILRHMPDDPVREVTDILSKRLADDAIFPLTRPEYALLGMHFGNICTLNRDWAIDRRGVLFPHGNLAAWRDAFGSYIRFNRPFKNIFEILQEDFEFAIDNLNILSTAQVGGKDLVDRLGQHIFTYYLWEVYPLTGDESLLERFYNKTSDDRERWAQLFDYVGRSLRNSGRHLDRALTDRIIAFFDWRLEVGEKQELQEFTFWLEAECLDPEWRLRAYSKILDLRREKERGIFIEMKALNKLLPDHLALVVECFAKITDAMDQGTQIYISINEAKPILKAGLTAEDPQVRENAERARENLLRLGRFDFLDVE